MKALPRHPEFMGRLILIGDRVRTENGGWQIIQDIKIRGLTFDGAAHDEPEIWLSAVGRTSTVIYPRDVLEHESMQGVTQWVGDHVPRTTRDSRHTKLT